MTNSNQSSVNNQNAAAKQRALKWLEPNKIGSSALLRDAFFDRVRLVKGTRLGPFSVVSELGRGGMGTVYLAERCDGAFNQTVAIKCVSEREQDLPIPDNQSSSSAERGRTDNESSSSAQRDRTDNESSSSAQRDRTDNESDPKEPHQASTPQDEQLQIRNWMFRRERQLLADFKHPHIARVIDGGTHEGMMWCAMELIRGQTLDAHLKSHQPPLVACLQWLMQISDAVSTAHDRLLIHRDIKPGNIMIDDDGSAKLLDFGIASWSQSASLPSAERARTENESAIAFSPRWASPEQIAGATVGPASDQFQLGSLLTFMLDTHTGADMPHGMRAAELRAIAAQATEQSPAARYVSVRAFSDELQRWISGHAVQAYSRGWWYQLQTVVRRHPWQSASLLAALATIIGLTVFNQVRLKTERDLARAAEQRARYEATTAQQINRYLQDDLLVLGDPNVSQDADLKMRDLLQRAGKTIPLRFAKRPEIAAELHTVLGRGLRELDQFDAADLQFNQALSLAKQSMPANDLRRLELDFWIADLQHALGNYQQAYGLYQALAKTAIISLGPDAELTQKVRVREQWSRFNVGAEREAAIDALTKLQPALDRARGEDSVIAIDALNQRAVMLSRMERLEDSLAIRGLHLERAERRYGKLHSSPLIGRLNSASTLRKLGRYPAALAEADIALLGLAKIFGPDSSTTLSAISIKSRILHEMGQFDLAIASLQEVISGQTKILGADHDIVAAAQINLSYVFIDANRLAEAITAQKESLRILEKLYPPAHIDTIANLHVLGDCLRLAGRYAESEQYLQLARKRAEPALAADDLDLAYVRFRLAQLKITLVLPIFRQRMRATQTHLKEAEALLLSLK
jgi:eukaryotic-like serine/threonine-protein kinase